MNRNQRIDIRIFKGSKFQKIEMALHFILTVLASFQNNFFEMRKILALHFWLFKKKTKDNSSINFKLLHMWSLK
jgi:hypothetical protein